jgi:hypothetical protein
MANDNGKNPHWHPTQNPLGSIPPKPQPQPSPPGWRPGKSAA